MPETPALRCVSLTRWVSRRASPSPPPSQDVPCAGLANLCTRGLRVHPQHRGAASTQTPAGPQQPQIASCGQP